MLKYNVRTHSTNKRITSSLMNRLLGICKDQLYISPRKTGKFLELLRQRKRNQVACMRTSSYIPQVQLAGMVIQNEAFMKARGNKINAKIP